MNLQVRLYDSSQDVVSIVYLVVENSFLTFELEGKERVWNMVFTAVLFLSGYHFKVPL